MLGAEPAGVDEGHSCIRIKVGELGDGGLLGDFGC